MVDLIITLLSLQIAGVSMVTDRNLTVRLPRELLQHRNAFVCTSLQVRVTRKNIDVKKSIGWIMSLLPKTFNFLFPRIDKPRFTVSAI